MTMRVGLVVIVWAVIVTGQITCNVVDFGAISDGKTLNTVAFQEAADACGGFGPVSNTLLVPQGCFLTGSFKLSSFTTLQVEHGGILKGSNKEEDYPVIDVLPSYGTGRDQHVGGEKRYQPLVFATNVTNVRITGQGTIDGNGEAWYYRFFAQKNKWTRPRLIEFMYSTHLVVDRLHLKDSAFWTLHLYASDHVVVRALRITAPPWGANTDGVDPDSCSDVLIEDCYMSLADDAVAIKSGLNAAGREFGRPSQNIVIRNLTIEPSLDNLCTNGISIGSEMSGGVRNVTVTDITMAHVEAGVYIKTMMGRGGYVRDVTFSRIRVRHALEPIKFVMHYTYLPREGVDAVDGDVDVPVIDRRTVSDLTATGLLTSAGSLQGLSNSVISNLTLSNIHLEGVLGWRKCESVDGTFEDVHPPPPCILEAKRE